MQDRGHFLSIKAMEGPKGPQLQMTAKPQTVHSEQTVPHEMHERGHSTDDGKEHKGDDHGPLKNRVSQDVGGQGGKYVFGYYPGATCCEEGEFEYPSRIPVWLVFHLRDTR